MRTLFNILCLININLSVDKYLAEWERNNVCCCVVHHLADAKQAIQRIEFNMIVLVDSNLADVMNAIESLRAATWVPIGVMLGVKADIQMKTRLLEAGALNVDEYSDSKDCVAYTMAVLRRYMELHQHTVVPKVMHIHSDLMLSPIMRTVYVGDQLVRLNRKQFDILHLLIQEPGRVFTFSQILRLVWGEEYADSPKSLVYVQIQQLRGKIQADPRLPQFIKTVVGVGYSFDPE